MCARVCVVCCALEGEEDKCVCGCIHVRACMPVCVYARAVKWAAIGVIGLWSLRLEHAGERGKGER